MMEKTRPLICPFQWVGAVGFGWCEAEGQAELAGGPEGWLLDEGVAAKTYKPPSQPAVFMTFANIPAVPDTPGHVAEFLARFALGRRSKGEALPQDRQGIVEKVSGPGTTLADWLHARWELTFAVEVWDKLRRKEYEQLASHIIWEDDPDGGRRVVYDSRAGRNVGDFNLRPPVRDVIASRAVRPEWLADFREGDVALPAGAYVQAKINAHLDGQIHTVLLWDDRRGRSCLHSVPRTFLASLWLQFAQAVTKDREYRRCAQCLAYIELSPETARTNRQFCGNACRLRLFRERQQRARRMFELGLPPRVIATELNRSEKTIKRWLQGRKGGGENDKAGGGKGGRQEREDPES
jgi:hypothetical protein